MSARAATLTTLALAVMTGLAGCGGRPANVADCLNARGFLVQQRAGVIRGSSAGGVNFMITLFSQAGAARRVLRSHPSEDAEVIGAALLDFAGNPPAAHGQRVTLSPLALGAIRSCLRRP